MYNLTWSTDGLINEYCNPCEAIYDGERVEVRALEGYETLSLDGVTYEAFNTSGGLGTLCETLDGRVRTLDYKSIRYQGHREYAKLLTRELRLGERRSLFRDVLETAVPATTQDVIVVFVTASGQRDGQLMQETFARKIYPQNGGGNSLPLSAIQLTTAAGACTMLDMLYEGQLPSQGFVRQEQATLDAFLANRFGCHYGEAEANHMMKTAAS
jgi:saccharopine dehydrogenase-like NADP-dependent oxidoreductase